MFWVISFALGLGRSKPRFIKFKGGPFGPPFALLGGVPMGTHIYVFVLYGFYEKQR